MTRVVVVSAIIALIAAPSATDPQQVGRLYHEWVAPSILAATEDEQKLADAVAKAFEEEHGSAIVADPNMTLACRRLCTVLDCRENAQDPSWESQTIQFYLRKTGITDAFIFPVVAHASSVESAQMVLQRLLKKDVAPKGLNRFGVSWDPTSHTVTAAFTRRLAQLAPFPMTAQPGSNHKLWGTLLQSTSRPQIILATPEGGTIQFSPGQATTLFWSTIYFPDEPGEYLIELLVENDGPQVSSLFPVYVGIEPPEFPILKLYPQLDESLEATGLEQQMMGLLNRERRKQGLLECMHNRSLAETARSHSHAMARTGTLTHTLLDGEERPQISYIENVSVSTSLSTAHTNLMGSPSHRRNVLDTSIDCCGIGIVVRSNADGLRLLYVTQRFASGCKQ